MSEIFVTTFQYAIRFFETYLVFWIVITLLEYFSPAEKKQKLISKHSLNELLNGLLIAIILWPMNETFEVFFIERFFEPYLPYHLLNNFIKETPFLFQVFFALVILDISQYLRHRLMHSHLFWSFHATHHSAIELRSTTHFRFHPLDYIASIVFKMLFLHVLGFEGLAIQQAVVVIVFNSMWKHANIDFEYGPFRNVLVSPNYHKWHHSSHKEAYNKNFADLFPILDIIGGTYYFPKNKLPEGYGISGESSDSPVHQTYIATLLYPITQCFNKKSDTPDVPKS